MGQKLHVFVRKVNHIPEQSAGIAFTYFLAELAATWAPMGEVNHFIGALQAPLWRLLLDNRGFHWPIGHIARRDWNQKFMKNLPILEEAFQQNEVENDKNLVIYQKSADTQKHYKVCQNYFC